MVLKGLAEFKQMLLNDCGSWGPASAMLVLVRRSEQGHTSSHVCFTFIQAHHLKYNIIHLLRPGG